MTEATIEQLAADFELVSIRTIQSDMQCRDPIAASRNRDDLKLSYHLIQMQPSENAIAFAFHFRALVGDKPEPTFNFHAHYLVEYSAKKIDPTKTEEFVAAQFSIFVALMALYPYVRHQIDVAARDSGIEGGMLVPMLLRSELDDAFSGMLVHDHEEPVAPEQHVKT